MHKEELTDGQSLRGFALATIAFLAIFAATAIPIPLYADYQATIGLTTADISNTMFTYLTGVALTLLLAGRISDAFGRSRSFPAAARTVKCARISNHSRPQWFSFFRQIGTSCSSSLGLCAVPSALSR